MSRKAHSSLIRPAQTPSDPLPSRRSRATCWGMSRYAHAHAHLAVNIPIPIPIPTRIPYHTTCTCQVSCSSLGSLTPYTTPLSRSWLTPNKKIRERQLAAPADSETLQALVVNELKAKSHKATEGLVWLVRYAHGLPRVSAMTPLI